MLDFKGKVVLITGGNTGIGASIGREFAKLGAHIVINYIFDPESADALVEEFSGYGAKSIKVFGDVTKFADCEEMVKAATNEFGQLDVLINNAGITKDKLMLRMSEEDFDQVINVNLKGNWNMMKNVTRVMSKQRYGRIINISSVVALMGNPGQINYVASKAGVIGMTKSLAKELAPRGVTVNAVAPGFIETAMTDKLSEEVMQYYLDNIPMKKMGQPLDIAKACLFLASDLADYITGQTLSVNGGLFMY